MRDELTNCLLTPENGQGQYNWLMNFNLMEIEVDHFFLVPCKLTGYSVWLTGRVSQRLIEFISIVLRRVKNHAF